MSDQCCHSLIQLTFEYGRFFPLDVVQQRNYDKRFVSYSNHHTIEQNRWTNSSDNFIFLVLCAYCGLSIEEKHFCTTQHEWFDQPGFWSEERNENFLIVRPFFLIIMRRWTCRNRARPHSLEKTDGFFQQKKIETSRFLGRSRTISIGNSFVLSWCERTSTLIRRNIHQFFQQRSSLA